jgi:S1-C subfamily serine protease
LNRRLVRFYKLAKEQAVEVISVDPQGPAGRAGMKEGDFILMVNDQAVASVDDLHRLLAEGFIGRMVPMTLLRGQDKFQLEVIPGEASPDR